MPCFLKIIVITYLDHLCGVSIMMAHRSQGCKGLKCSHVPFLAKQRSPHAFHTFRVEVSPPSNKTDLLLTSAQEYFMPSTILKKKQRKLKKLKKKSFSVSMIAIVNSLGKQTARNLGVKETHEIFLFLWQ